MRARISGSTTTGNNNRLRLSQESEGAVVVRKRVMPVERRAPAGLVGRGRGKEDRLGKPDYGITPPD